MEADKAIVLATYPRAYSTKSTLLGRVGWVIYGTDHPTIYGNASNGVTEPEAWAMAARRIEKNGK